MCMCVCVHVCVCIYVHVCVCVCACVSVCVMLMNANGVSPCYVCKYYLINSPATNNVANCEVTKNSLDDVATNTLH